MYSIDRYKLFLPVLYTILYYSYTSSIRADVWHPITTIFYSAHLKFTVSGWSKQASKHTHVCNAVTQVWGSLRLTLSLVPRPTPFFVLRFAFNIIHGGRRVLFHLRVLCKPKNGIGLGTRLAHPNKPHKHYLWDCLLGRRLIIAGQA